MRVGVLASGAGTNLQALLDRVHRPGTDVEIVAVGSDRADAPALTRAARAGVPTEVFVLAAHPDRAAHAGVPTEGSAVPVHPDRAAHAGVPTEGSAAPAHPDRAARDAAMAAWLSAHRVELVVLAGYMQLLTAGFLATFPDRVINVHPALLPAFPGLGAVEQALAYGVRVFGVTVHFVDEGVDSGRIIAQRAVELPGATSPGEVHDALRPVEHALLCEAVERIAHGAVRFDPGHPRRVLVHDR